MSVHWETLVSGAFDRSREHAPQDRATLRAAACELATRGALTPRYVAAALRLSEAAARGMLGLQVAPCL